MVTVIQRLGAGALGLDVSRLLALVANLLTTARVLGAVAGEVTSFATVVAFAAINAITYDSSDYDTHVTGSQGYSRDMWPTPPQE